jgi:hypothetical protein
LEAHVSGANIPKRWFGLRRGIKAEHLNDRQWNVILRDMSIGLRSISTGAPGLPIVMGGGVATKQSHRLPLLQRMVGRLKSSCPAPVLHLAEHGEDSGLMGGCLRRVATRGIGGQGSFAAFLPSPRKTVHHPEIYHVKI